MVVDNDGGAGFGIGQGVGPVDQFVLVEVCWKIFCFGGVIVLWIMLVWLILSSCCGDDEEEGVQGGEFYDHGEFFDWYSFYFDFGGW